ncbi:MAG: hypothetical protein K8R46_08660, partial [Pirellulales bacterium]|nr:hypothetical protein [Pirellulales bacterium]
RRIDLTAAKMGLSPWRRGLGTVPKFLANRLPAKCVFWPKNGPVPSQPVNAYRKIHQNRRCTNYLFRG